MHHRGKALCCLILVGSLFLLGGCGGSGSGDGGGGGTPTPDITPISWLNGPWGFTGGSGRWSGNSFSGPMTLVRGEYLIENAQESGNMTLTGISVWNALLQGGLAATMTLDTHGAIHATVTRTGDHSFRAQRTEASGAYVLDVARSGDSIIAQQRGHVYVENVRFEYVINATLARQ